MHQNLTCDPSRSSKKIPLSETDETDGGEMHGRIAATSRAQLIKRKEHMRRHLIIVSTIFLVAFLIFFTPLINGGVEADQGDATWRNCNWQTGLCHRISPIYPRFNAEQESFLKQLESIPTPPARITREELAQRFGANPSGDFNNGTGLLLWTNVGPGTNPDRLVSVFMYAGQMHSIRWFDRASIDLHRSFQTKK